MSKLAVTIDQHTYRVELDLARADEAQIVATIDGEPVRVIIPNADAALAEMEWLVIDDRPYEIVFDPELHWIKAHGHSRRVHIRNLEQAVARPRSSDGRVKAPIPGQITQLFVDDGQTVEAGERLLILEAMKMENQILAPRAGTVGSIHVTTGQSVAIGQVMVELV